MAVQDLEWPSVYDSYNTSFLGKYEFPKLCDADLIKRLINTLRARCVRSEVNIWYQSATSDDMRSRGYSITRLEGIDSHPIKTSCKKENPGDGELVLGCPESVFLSQTCFLKQCTFIQT